NRQTRASFSSESTVSLQSPNLRDRGKSLFLCLASIVITVVCFSSPSAQTSSRGWEWQNPLPQGNAISAIRFAGDKLHGWAVGADGVILYTNDGGFRWEHQPTRLVNALNGLYVFDRQHAFAVGARGLVVETRNAGDKWLEVATPTKDHLYAITFAADNAARGWAVGTYGCILATTNGGATWTIQKTPTRAHLYSVSFTNKNLGVAVGDRGTVLRTSDGGKHWKEVVRLGNLPFTGVALISEKRAIAVGYGGRIITSEDGGTVWEPVDSLVSDDLLAVCFID